MVVVAFVIIFYFYFEESQPSIQLSPHTVEKNVEPFITETTATETDVDSNAPATDKKSARKTKIRSPEPEVLTNSWFDDPDAPDLGTTITPGGRRSSRIRSRNLATPKK